MPSSSKLCLSLIIVSMLWFSKSDAETDCGSFIEHGFYNRVREGRQASSFALERHAICETYSSYQSDSKNNSVKSSYDVFSLGLKFKSDQIRSVGRMMCSNDYSEKQSNEIITKASEFIDPTAVQAFRDCIALDADGLAIRTQIHKDDERFVSYEVRYRTLLGVSILSTPEIRSVTVMPPDAFSCGGELWEMRNDNSEIGNKTASMLCKRDVKTTPFTDGQRMVLAASASIQISTSAGSITTHFTPITPRIERIPPGVGEVVASLLDPAKFIAAYGSDWVLADGRPVPNTPFAHHIGNNVPDLRGVFLRGLNAGRNQMEDQESFTDPDSDRKVGSLQTTGFNLRRTSHETGSHGTGYRMFDQTSHIPHFQIVPPNAAVYYYVRVDADPTKI